MQSIENLSYNPTSLLLSENRILHKSNETVDDLTSFNTVLGIDQENNNRITQYMPKIVNVLFVMIMTATAVLFFITVSFGITDKAISKRVLWMILSTILSAIGAVFLRFIQVKYIQ